MSSYKEKLDSEQLERTAKMLKAISHPIRIGIIDFLDREGEKNVTEIYKEMELEQAPASHHLGILKNNGVLSSVRKGKNIVYSLRHDRLGKIIESVEQCYS